MNHAFLILAHDSSELLQRIVDRLSAPNHYVFIHLDSKANLDVVGNDRVHVLNQRINIAHGGYSMLKAELLLLQCAFNQNISFDYFHLLSGHDYPCVGNDEFDSFFENVPEGRSFMHYDSDAQHVQWHDKIDVRVNKWHLKDFHHNSLIRRSCEIFLNVFVKRSFDGELYAGWQWFSWYRSLVKWVLDYYGANPDYFNRFRHTTCCDEVVFHTLLHSHIEELNIEKDDSLRYIDWYPNRPAKSLPLVLDERDYDSVKASGALFCRKVYMKESGRLLDMLDKE